MATLLLVPTPVTATATAGKTDPTRSTTTATPKTTPKIADTGPMQIDWMLGIILITGLLGGYLNFLRTQHAVDPTTGKPQTTHKNYRLLCLVGGVVAAALIPLFLKTIQSGLLDKDVNQISYMVFAGFCLIAAIFSNTFIDTLSKQVFRQLEQINAKADDAKKTATDASTKAQSADNKATTAQQTANATVTAMTDTPPPTPPTGPNARGEIVESLTAKPTVVDPSLSSPARLVLSALTASTSFFNSHAAIAQKTQIDTGAVQDGLNELLQKEYILPVPKGDETVYALNKKKAL